MGKQNITRTDGPAGSQNSKGIREYILKSGKWWIIFSVVVLLAFGCQKDVLNTVSDQDDPNNGIREEYVNEDAFKMQDASSYADLNFQSNTTDENFNKCLIMPELPDWATRYFVMNRAVIQRDRLIVTVSYPGGCRPHTFRLVSTTLQESNPIQVTAQIFHLNNEDPCDGWITKDLVFDLTPLKLLYFQIYDESEGTIVINLVDIFGSQEAAPLIYHFYKKNIPLPPGPPLPPLHHPDEAW